MPNTNIQCGEDREYSAPLDPKEPKEPNARLYYPKDCGQKDVRVHIEADGSLSDGLIADGSLFLDKLVDIPDNTIIGNNTGGASSPIVLTPTQGISLLNSDGSFDAQVRTSGLDQMAIPTANVDMNNQRVANVANPTANGDAVNRVTMRAEDTIITNTIPNYSQLISYNSRAELLSATPTDLQKLNLLDGLNTYLRFDKKIPDYYIRAGVGVFTASNTTFVAGGSGGVNGTFGGTLGSRPTLTTTSGGFLSFSNSYTNSGEGIISTNFAPNGFNNSFIVDIWMSQNTSQPVQRRVCYGEPAKAVFEVMSVSTTTIELRVFNNGSNTAVRIGRRSPLNTGIRKYSFHYNNQTQTSADIKIYENGVRVDNTDSNVGTFTAPVSSSTDNLEIGSYFGGANASLTPIFQVGIVKDKTRTDAEELALYNAQKSEYGL